MKGAQSCKLMLSAILLVGSIVCSPKAFSADCSIYYLPSMNFVQGPPNGGSPDPYSARLRWRLGRRNVGSYLRSHEIPDGFSGNDDGRNGCVG